MEFARIDDVVLSFRRDGPRAAPALVFANPLGADYRIWDDTVEALGGRFHTVRYDKRGHGLSSWPAADSCTIADHAADLAGLLDLLEIERAVVCGLSIGGLIAQQLAAERRGLVRGLILCGTAAAIGPPEIWDARIRQVRKTGLAPLAETILERWFGATYRRRRAQQLAGWANMLSRVPPEGYIGSCAALRDADLSASTAGLRLPAMCVCGSEDTPTPPHAVRSLAALIPGSRFETIEGAGHLSCIEAPAALAGLIDDFAEEHNLV